MLHVLIGKNRIQLKDDDGLNLPLSFESIKIDFEEGVLPSLRLGGSYTSSTIVQKNDNSRGAAPVDVAKLLQSKRKKKDKKKVSDYIAEVFRVARMPLSAGDIAQLISELTEYDVSQSKSPNASMRSAMAREKVGESEENRFLQLNSTYWLLAELEEELEKEGKLSDYQLEETSENERDEQ